MLLRTAPNPDAYTPPPIDSNILNVCPDATPCGPPVPFYGQATPGFGSGDGHALPGPAHRAATVETCLPTVKRRPSCCPASTPTGDQGTTALGDGSRAAKTDLRLAAYADVDEANCAIGVAVTIGGLAGTCASCSSASRTSCSTSGGPEQPHHARARLSPAAGGPGVHRGPEAACDQYNAELPTLRSSCCPGAALARPCCTRPHRGPAGRAVRLAALGEHGETMNPLTAQYLNRLSTCCSSWPGTSTSPAATCSGNRAATARPPVGGESSAVPFVINFPSKG